MFFSSSKQYSLSKSRHIMKSSFNWFSKKGDELSPDILSSFESKLRALDQALLQSNRPEANLLARDLESFCGAHFKKSMSDYFLEIFGAIIVALIIATLVRQMWFEIYEIPTGSMRPTFEEQDHLTVSKTAFGINTPLKTSHLYFNPHLVQRGGIVIWSGEGISHLDSKSSFMKIFPYTKRYIKRCMGKPGDTLYFYGGKIYGYSSDGVDLKELREDPHLAKLEYIPFTNFEGRRSYTQDPLTKLISQISFHLVNNDLGRYRFDPSKQEIAGEIYNGVEWIKDEPLAQVHPHNELKTYSDFFGLRNFAICRLLNKTQVESLTNESLADLGEAPLYLELRHTPSLSYPGPHLSEHIGASIMGYRTLIPLQEKHLKKILENIYTCRFVIKNGKGTTYMMDQKGFPTSNTPSFPNIPNGTYEFYYGKGYQIDWGGIASLLPSDHPLYSNKPSHIQKLFNVGIEMSTMMEPHHKNQALYPNRYTYFRDGDLYIMGVPVLTKGDPLLIAFNERELKKEKASTQQKPYVAFKDFGPPVKSTGELNKEFISAFGLRIPEKHYLCLGDNHAMSQDSRYFGPVPEANLQGVPSLIIWPPGDRWGIPNQRPYPLINCSRMVIWGIVGFISLIWWIWHRRSLKRSFFPPQK